MADRDGALVQVKVRFSPVEVELAERCRGALSRNSYLRELVRRDAAARGVSVVPVPVPGQTELPVEPEGDEVPRVVRLLGSRPGTGYGGSGS